MFNEEKLTEEIRLRVTPSTRKTYDELAAKEHLKTSTYCRARLMDHLSQVLPTNHPVKQPRNFLEMLEAN